jgi:hypothetical protein
MNWRRRFRSRWKDRQARIRRAQVERSWRAICSGGFRSNTRNPERVRGNDSRDLGFAVKGCIARARFDRCGSSKRQQLITLCGTVPNGPDGFVQRQ